MAGADEKPVFLTTKEVAELLRVKERKVYDLAAANEIPFRRVTGKLLFPRDEIEAWIAGGADPRVASASVAITAARRPNVIVGSHDPLLEWALRESQSGLASLFDGSLDGLDRLAAGEAAAAGLHVPEAGGEWNRRTVATRLTDDAFVLVEWAKRRRGLVVRPDLSAAVRSLADLPGRRVVARQPGAGGRLIFERLMAEAGIAAGDVEIAAPLARTEAEAVEAVVSGAADVALGLEAMARRFALGFAPLLEERFDLVVERRAYFEPPLQKLWAFARGAAFAERADALGGYNLAGHGRVVWNGV